jgi:hypothetical protein
MVFNLGLNQHQLNIHIIMLKKKNQRLSLRSKDSRNKEKKANKYGKRRLVSAREYYYNLNYIIDCNYEKSNGSS